MRLLTQSRQIFAATESDIQNAALLKENCDLELAPTEQNDQFIDARVYSILAQIGNFCKAAIAIITQEPEVEVRQKQDRNGHIHWHVYDPKLGESISFASELEMLSWLDNQNGRW
jgi:hypothetical protein